MMALHAFLALKKFKSLNLSVMFLVILLAIVFLSSVAKASDPQTIKKVRVDPKLGTQVPLDLPFVDETGKSVKLGDYFGKLPVILTPVYYECPMLCNLVLNGVLHSLKSLKFSVGRDFQVVSYSIDPGETPEVATAKKKSYIASYNREGAEAGWHFLTGPQSSIQALSDTIGFHYEYDKKVDEFAHAASIQVLTPEGKIANYFGGIDFPSRDMKLAILESSKEKIGSAMDLFLMLCFHYDPTAGKYNLAIFSLLRVFGILTVAILACFIFLSLKQDRRRLLPS